MAHYLQAGAYLSIYYTNTLIQILQAHDRKEEIFSTVKVPVEFQIFCESKGISLRVAFRVHETDPTAWKLTPEVIRRWEIHPYNKVREKKGDRKVWYYVINISNALAYIQNMTQSRPKFIWVLLDDLEPLVDQA